MAGNNQNKNLNGTFPMGKVPPWFTQAFKEFKDHQERLSELLDLSRTGIQLVRIFVEAETTSTDPVLQKSLRDAKVKLDLAKNEIDGDFPTLHSQAVVSLWGSLETLVLDVAATWILNYPEVLHRDQWRSLKIRIGEYETLDTEQKASYLASAMDQLTSGPLKAGVGRFEGLLEAIGLKGTVEEDVRRGLFELQQIRNEIVHKRSIADRKFCDACPWLAINPGDVVLVSNTMYKNYFHISYMYVIELMCRTGEFFKVEDIRSVIRNHLQEIGWR